jgi:hypothetical protein
MWHQESGSVFQKPMKRISDQNLKLKNSKIQAQVGLFKISDINTTGKRFSATTNLQHLHICSRIQVDESPQDAIEHKDTHPNHLLAPQSTQE